MEGNIEKLSSVITCGRTINSEDVTELQRIGITVVDNNYPLEENITYVGAPVNEGGGGGYTMGRFEEMMGSIPRKRRNTIALVRIFRVSELPLSLT